MVYCRLRSRKLCEQLVDAAVAFVRFAGALEDQCLSGMEGRVIGVARGILGFERFVCRRRNVDAL